MRRSNEWCLTLYQRKAEKQKGNIPKWFVRVSLRKENTGGRQNLTNLDFSQLFEERCEQAFPPRKVDERVLRPRLLHKRLFKPLHTRQYGSWHLNPTLRGNAEFSQASASGSTCLPTPPLTLQHGAPPCIWSPGAEPTPTLRCNSAPHPLAPPYFCPLGSELRPRPSQETLAPRSEGPVPPSLRRQGPGSDPGPARRPRPPPAGTWHTLVDGQASELPPRRGSLPRPCSAAPPHA